MQSLDGLRPEVVTDALRRIGSSSQVTACELVRQSAYNLSYDIVLDGAPAALNVWFGEPAGAEAELALRHRLVSCGLPVQNVLVAEAHERLTVAGHPAVVLQRLQGEDGPNYMPAKATPSYIETAAAMARLVARIHVGALGLEDLAYREAPWLTNLASWRTELNMSRADARAKAILDQMDAAATRFLAFCDDEQLPVGVVHGCPGAWTVLVTPRWQIAALLELDSAHRDHLVFDIAHLITQWGQCAVSETRARFEPVLVRRILKEYSAVRPPVRRGAPGSCYRSSPPQLHRQAPHLECGWQRASGAVLLVRIPGWDESRAFRGFGVAGACHGRGLTAPAAGDGNGVIGHLFRGGGTVARRKPCCRLYALEGGREAPPERL